MRQEAWKWWWQCVLRGVAVRFGFFGFVFLGAEVGGKLGICGYGGG